MNKFHGIMTVLVLGCLCNIQAKEATAKGVKTELRAAHAPSVQEAMNIEKNICVPLKSLEKTQKNPLIAQLYGIAEDLSKLAVKKIAVKYETFVKATKSFEQGFEESEHKAAYLETWLAMANKRVSKLADYKGRLEKIKGRLTVLDKKIEELKDSDVALKATLANYSAQLKNDFEMTNQWIAKSEKVFSMQRNKLKSREAKLKEAGAL